MQIWAGPLAGSARAVVLFNRHTTGSQYLNTNITVPWELLGIPSGTQAVVRDLFVETDCGTFQTSFTAPVPTHGVVMLRITREQPANREPQWDDGWRPWHAGVVTMGRLTSTLGAGPGGQGMKLVHAQALPGMLGPTRHVGQPEAPHRKWGGMVEAE